LNKSISFSLYIYNIEQFIVEFFKSLLNIYYLYKKFYLQCSWNYSIVVRVIHTTKHCKCFTWSSLTICKYCWIPTHKKVIYMANCYPIVHFFLTCSFAKYVIKAITILPIIYHRTIILDKRLLSSFRISHSTVYFDVTESFIRLLRIVLTDIFFHLHLLNHLNFLWWVFTIKILLR
jgi:hypothetical protein